MGYACRIYERREVPGGLNTHGIAAYKMRARGRAARGRAGASRSGVEVRERRRGRQVRDGRRRSGTRPTPCSSASGSGSTEELGLPGETLPGVVDAIALHRPPQEPAVPRRADVGRNVVVIGGGNTAVDAATQAKRLGAENVLVVYRRGPEDVLGLRTTSSSWPRRTASSTSSTRSRCASWATARVEALECVRTETVRRGRPARRSAADPGLRVRDPLRHGDHGGRAEEARGVARGDVPGIALDRRPRETDAHGRTSVPRAVRGGDCVNGGKEVVNAVAEGKARRARDRRGTWEAEGLTMADLTIELRAASRARTRSGSPRRRRPTPATR